jgi:hypothetical protein
MMEKQVNINFGRQIFNKDYFQNKLFFWNSTERSLQDKIFLYVLLGVTLVH